MQDGERVMQKNEGGWEFSLEESADGRALELDIAVGRFLDTSLINADVQPLFVRMLIKASPAVPAATGAYVQKIEGNSSELRTPLKCRGTCCSLPCPKRSGQTRALHRDRPPLGACY